MTLPNPGEAPGAMAVPHNYVLEGYQLQNATGRDVSSSSGMGAGQIHDRQGQEQEPSRE